jgi:hypothetical protein
MNLIADTKSKLYLPPLGRVDNHRSEINVEARNTTLR